MDLLDGTIVNVAAPSIRADLGASLSALQWIAGGYALTFAVGLVTGGRLGDIYGRRRLFLLGVAGFTAASLLCGLAPTSEALIAARLLQGALRGDDDPAGLRDHPRRRSRRTRSARRSALFGPVIGLSAVLGPVLGGALVDGDLFGARLAADLPRQPPARPPPRSSLGARLLPESRAEHPPTLDLVGAALVTRRRRPARLPADPGPRGRLARVDVRRRWPPRCVVLAASSPSSAGASAPASRRS